MEEDYVMIPGSGTKKIIRDVKKEIETAFLDYSMSVIVSRALPYMLMYLAGIECPQYRDELNVLGDKYNAKRPRILKHQADYDELMRKEKEEAAKKEAAAKKNSSGQVSSKKKTNKRNKK